MAGAPKLNKNAEKWNLPEATKFIDSVYEYVQSHKDCCSLEEACCELGQYENLFIYLRNKYKDIDFKAVKKAKAILSQRMQKKALNNEFNPTMSIFLLKVNHGMQDKQVIEHEGKINILNLGEGKANETTT